MNYKLFFLIISALILQNNCQSSKIKLQEGDLLFKQELDDSFSEAIASATKSIQELNFTHVGVAHCEKGEWYVIEAISKGVCQTPITEFTNPNSIIIVGRLKNEYQTIIPKSIERILLTVGTDYDNYFSADNNQYYCSELIQQNYLQAEKPIFSPIEMTFKDKKTGETHPYWKEHFAKLNINVPEGELGSNPGQLSQSDKIVILGRFQ